MEDSTNWRQKRNLRQSEFEAVFRSLPSDSESEVSETGLSDDNEEPEPIFIGADDDIMGSDEEPTAPAANSDGEFSEDDEIPLSTFQWDKKTEDIKAPGSFSEPSGPNMNICSQAEVESDFFSLIFDDDLLDRIVFETSLYCTQKGKHFTPTTRAEIKAFIGLNMIMGIVRLPSYRDFWSSKMSLRNEFVCCSMSQKRFSFLLSHMHLNDNSSAKKKGEEGYDKLFKVRPYVDGLNKKYQELYHPTQHQSIDESMIAFKGRSSLKQYMPLKPIKRGYKVWARADENGFICQFKIYTGKTGDCTEKHLGARVVMELCEPLKNRHYRVFFDNYFSSIQLFSYLKKHEINACGTIRKDRKEIPSLETKLVRGEFNFKVRGDGISVVVWMDRKPVFVVSNYQDPSEAEIVQRKEKDGTKKAVTIPCIIAEYNRRMGYLDKADQLKSYYEIDRKSRKWWYRIFWHFVDVSLVNAFVIFKCIKGNLACPTLKEFRLNVAESLVTSGQKTKRGRPSSAESFGSPPLMKRFKVPIPSARRTNGTHMPVHVESARRCNHCSTTETVRRSRWTCSECKVALCLNERNNCFLNFHN